MSKIIPESVSKQLSLIAGILTAKVLTDGVPLKDLSLRSNLTPATVKKILEGQTANIDSYIMVAEALGLDLFQVCAQAEKTLQEAG